MKTVNRGKLLRDAKKGLLEAKCLFHYTDDYLRDVADNFGKTDWYPLRIRADYNDFVQGQMNLWEHDFKSKVGLAYMDGEGIHLHVHSNLVYQIRYREQKRRGAD